MTSILIVDDSPIDRLLVGELLSKNPGIQLQFASEGAALEDRDLGELAASDFHVGLQYAANGVEALDKLSQFLPDLIVTDLLMPEMNGLQLVTEVRAKYPHIPVILMTSQGSEEIAVRALQLGAASYVPKKLLMRYLWETIEKVLKASAEDRGQARLIDCMVRTDSIFRLENDRELFEPLIKYLQEETIRLGVCAHADRVRIGVALEEALSNALDHGNLELASELRGTSEYRTMLESRRRQSPYQERRIEVEVNLSRDEAVFSIRDQGPGFSANSLPDPTDPANLEKAFGRGIFLMRAFMDEVRYNELGNAVVMVKRRQASGEVAETMAERR